MLPLAVLTVKRKRPSCEISTQHGAVWKSGNGDAPIEVSVPSAATPNAETVPLPAPSCAFETNTCVGSTGLNSLPNGPAPWATNGEPGAAVRRPSGPTRKLSIRDVFTRTPSRRVPSPLKRTSPDDERSGSDTVEP